MRWIGALRHFLTMFGYIWRSVSAVGGTNCSWEWTSNLPLATEKYLSWDSNPSRQGRVVSKRDAFTTRPRRPGSLSRNRHKHKTQETWHLIIIPKPKKSLLKNQKYIPFLNVSQYASKTFYRSKLFYKLIICKWFLDLSKNLRFRMLPVTILPENLVGNL